MSSTIRQLTGGFDIGDHVRYSPIIGGPHDGQVYNIIDFWIVSGKVVAKLEGKPGCVSISALALESEK